MCEERQERVPVLALDGTPLMPTKPQRARKWIESGRAEPIRNNLNQFTVRLKEEPSGREKQEIVATLDPGSKFSGVSVISKKAVLCGFNLELPTRVSRGMSKRRERRRNRRYRKTRRRRKKFDNRTKRRLSPSIKAKKQLELRVIEELSKTFPISQIGFENVCFNHYTKKWGSSFSRVEIGKRWLISKLGEIAPVTTFRGWEVSEEREKLGLKKTKDRNRRSPKPHVHDAIAIGSLILKGIVITRFQFDVITRPKFSRRKLHLEQPSKDGVRRRYGGTTTPFVFRKGDYVEATQGNKTVRGWVSGFTKNLISVSNFDWKRMGQFVASKTRLLDRDSGMLTKFMEVGGNSFHD